MGNVTDGMCCCRSKQSYETNPEIAAAEGLLSNLSNWKDVLDQVHQKFPIMNTNIVDFHKAVQSIGKDNFTMEEMKAKFILLEPWSTDPSLWEAGGDFENLLVNYLPANNKRDLAEGPIHWISLMSLALLWCEGSIQQKAEIMFQCANPKRQKENQKSIGCSDDELKILVDSMITFATIKALMYHFRNQMSMKTKKDINSYNRRRACYAQRNSEFDEEANRQGFILLLFGENSLLTREEFVKRMVSYKCSWIFDRKEIRNRQEKYFMDSEFLDKLFDQQVDGDDFKTYEPSPRGVNR